jgi:hypothetical protein
MKHRHLFVNSLFPHLKYPLRQQKFQNQAKALHEALQLEENQYKHTNPTMEELRQDLKNLTFQLNHYKGKEKREDVGVQCVGQKVIIRMSVHCLCSI